jgi:hypothetical protein
MAMGFRVSVAKRAQGGLEQTSLSMGDVSPRRSMLLEVTPADTRHHEPVNAYDDAPLGAA